MLLLTPLLGVLPEKRSYSWRNKLQESVEQRILKDEAICYKNSNIPAIQNIEVFDDSESSKDYDSDEKKKKKKKIESIKRKQTKITDMLSAKKKKNIVKTTTAVINVIN